MGDDIVRLAILGADGTPQRLVPVDTVGAGGIVSDDAVKVFTRLAGIPHLEDLFVGVVKNRAALVDRVPLKRLISDQQRPIGPFTRRVQGKANTSHFVHQFAVNEQLRPVAHVDNRLLRNTMDECWKEPRTDPPRKNRWVECVASADHRFILHDSS